MKELDGKLEKLRGDLDEEKGEGVRRTGEIFRGREDRGRLVEKRRRVLGEVWRSRARVGGLVDSVFKFMDECVNEYFNTVKKSEPDCKKELKIMHLELNRPPRYSISHLKYLNKKILNLDIDYKDEKTPTNNPNNPQHRSPPQNPKNPTKSHQ